MTPLVVTLVMAGIALIAISATGTVVSQEDKGQHGSEKWKIEIDKCMTSLKAENPRQAHLLECDEFMPLVPAMITSQMIENTTEINQNLDEYLTLRALDVNTEMLKQAKISQEEKNTTAATPIVNNTEDLMTYDENQREGIMNQLKQECGANSTTGGPLTYNDVINRENMTQTQEDCVNKILLE